MRFARPAILLAGFFALVQAVLAGGPAIAEKDAGFKRVPADKIDPEVAAVLAKVKPLEFKLAVDDKTKEKELKIQARGSWRAATRPRASTRSPIPITRASPAARTRPGARTPSCSRSQGRRRSPSRRSSTTARSLIPRFTTPTSTSTAARC